MDALGDRPKKTGAGLPVVEKAAKPPGKRESSIAARILTERNAIDAMAVKIRRNAKEIAANADRLLRRVS